VSRRHLIMLLALAAIWGSSFMFIKIGVRELEPATLIFFRCLFAAVTLLPLALATRGALQAIRGSWRPIVVMGTFNSAIPFWFLTWGETRIDSGLAAIIQAAAPIFTVILAFVFTSERVTGLRLAGIALGFVGVTLLVGDLGGGAVWGGLAVVVAALCYAGASIYGARRLRLVTPLAIALGSMSAATLLTAPFGLAQLPGEMPGWKTIVSVFVLGVGGSAIAYLLYFAIMIGAGATYAILVTYLVPAMAVLYGAVLLDEPVAAIALAGLALVLAGTAMGTGTVKR
jgi:drug/metabolite transporter (DMT)-like permease